MPTKLLHMIVNMTIWTSRQDLVLIASASSQGLPWPEFVVAKTLAKWEKLEPNEINLSEDLKF